MYASDVLLLARTLWELQTLLYTAIHWAAYSGMTWKTQKSFGMPPFSCADSFKLAGDTLQCKSEIESLVVTIALSVEANKMSVARFQAARAKWSSVLALKKRVGLIPTHTVVMLLKTEVRPVAEYGLHLCPITKKLVKAHEHLEARMVRKVLIILPPTALPCVRKLLRLQSF